MVACGAVILLVVFGLYGYRSVTTPARLRAFAEKYLRQRISTRVQVGAVDFHPMTGIAVTRVVIADPATPEDLDNPVLALNGVQLRHKPAWLLLGRLVIDEIDIDRVSVRAVFDEKQSAFNVQRLFRPESSAGRASSGHPDVHVGDVSLSVLKRNASGISGVDFLSLRFDAEYSKSQQTYRIDWVAESGDRGFGSCTFDRRTLSLIDEGGGTPWLRTATARLIVRATQPSADKWLEVVKPTGMLRIKDYHLHFSESASDPSEITVQLRDVALSVPAQVDEQTDSSLVRFLEFDQVTGNMTISGARAAADFSARLRGKPCQLHAKLRAPQGNWTSLAEVGFDIEGRFEELQLPRNDPKFAEEHRLIHAWRRFENFYRDFDPVGVVDVDVAIHKPSGTEKRVELKRIALKSIRTDATSRFFPYRVYDLQGRVEIRPDGVQLIGLTGHHGEDVITVDGWMSAPVRDCAAKLHVTGVGVALDGDLCEALNEKYRSLWHYAQPTGFADIDTTMVREQGRDGKPQPWTTVVQSELVGAGMQLEGFPYPITDLGGPVLIVGDTISAQQLHGRAGDGLVALDGVATLHQGRLEELRVDIQAAALQVDDSLIQALPEAPRRQILSFSPSGQASVDGVLTYRSDAELDYDFVASLDHLGARWRHVPLPLTDLTGNVDVSPGRIALMGVKARCDDAVLHVDGEIGIGARGLAPNLTGAMYGFKLTDKTRNAVPLAWRDRVNQWSIDGPMDLIGVISNAAAGAESQLQLSADLSGTVASHRDFGAPIHVDRGAVSIKAPIPTGDSAFDRDEANRQNSVPAPPTVARLGLQQIAGRCLGATIRADGVVRIEGDAIEIDLQGSAEDVELSQSLAQALPWRVRRMWNNLQPSGAVEVGLSRLVYRSDPADGLPRWAVDGEIRMTGVGLTTGVEFSGGEGSFRFRGESPSAFSSLSLHGDLNLDRLDAGGYPLSDIRAEVLRDGESGDWRFDDIKAEIHGGRIRGRFATLRNQRGETQLDASFSLAGVQLDGFLTRDQDSPDPSGPLAGMVNARGYLSVISGDRSSLRGGGNVTIEDAELYRLPVLLSILEVVSLQAPKESAFQRAESDFLLNGQTVTLDSLLMQGQSMAMIGDGSVDWPSRRLDLRLVSVSPHRWAKVPLLTELLEGASRELMQVRVRGTLANPIATAEPLRGISGAMRSLLNPRGGRAVPVSQSPSGSRR